METRNISKCDCIIIRFSNSSDQVIAFLIEFQGREYHLDDVKAKLQCCVNAMSEVLGKKAKKVRLFPVLCAKSHISIKWRTGFTFRIMINGRQEMIALVNYGANLNELYANT